ncbi:MAG: hypothetical protein RL169_2005, partial [Armatimonadota bacterium]
MDSLFPKLITTKISSNLIQKHYLVPR